MQKLLAHTSVLALMFGVGVFVAHAEGQTYQNPLEGIGVDSIPKLLLALVDLVFLIGVPIIVLFIIYSGFLFVSARDNDSKLGKAKTTFTWTIVGALVLLGAKAISLALQGTVNALK